MKRPAEPPTSMKLTRGQPVQPAEYMTGNGLPQAGAAGYSAWFNGSAERPAGYTHTYSQPTDRQGEAPPFSDDHDVVLVPLCWRRYEPALASHTSTTPQPHHSHTENAMEALADFCVYGKLKFKRPFGSAEQPADNENCPYDLGLRIKNLLQVTNEQREEHIARLCDRNDPRIQSREKLVFNDQDMQEIMNTWRNQPKTWSNSQNCINGQSHAGAKSCFSTMLFQLFGNKPLVDLLIRFPICCHSSVLRSFTQQFLCDKNSAEASRAREISQPKQPGQFSRSEQIRTLEMQRSRCARIRRKPEAEWSEDEKRLMVQFDSRETFERIKKLRMQKQPKNPGVAARLVASGCWM